MQLSLWFIPAPPAPSCLWGLSSLHCNFLIKYFHGGNRLSSALRNESCIYTLRRALSPYPIHLQAESNPGLGRCSKAFRKPLNFPYRGRCLRQCLKDLPDISLRGSFGPHTPQHPQMRSLSQMETRGKQKRETGFVRRAPKHRRSGEPGTCLLAPLSHLFLSFLSRKSSIYVKDFFNLETPLVFVGLTEISTSCFHHVKHYRRRRSGF